MAAIGIRAVAASMKTKGAQVAMKKKVEKTKTAELLPRRPNVLRFSPTAWAKLLFLRDAGETEIGGFGISAADDLLLVEDIVTVPQSCSWVHVAFDDAAVADFFDQQVDAGRRPEQFARIWIHTHPGRSADPSGTDEATFGRVFGRAEWALMFILARGGQTYARLRYNVGPGADINLPVDVEFGRPFSGSDAEAWQAEYAANVRTPEPEPITNVRFGKSSEVSDHADGFGGEWWRDAWDEYAEFDRNLVEGEYGYIRDF